MMTSNDAYAYLIAGLVGLSIGLAVDLASSGHPTWRAPVWAMIFLIGFYYNHNYGGRK
jgi:hypothetical protein